MKYIDAERLKCELEKRLKNVRDYMNGAGMKYKGPKYYKAQGKESAYDALLSVIDSLQQEQPEPPTCKSCGFYENNCPFIRDKFIPYPNRVCKDYTYSVMKEQPKEDIKKEYAEFVEADPVYSKLVNGIVGKAIARHFYELGLNARKK